MATRGHLLFLGLLVLLIRGTSQAKLPLKLRIAGFFLKEELGQKEALEAAVAAMNNRGLLEGSTLHAEVYSLDDDDFFHLNKKACEEAEEGPVAILGPSDPEMDEQLESMSEILHLPLVSSAPGRLNLGKFTLGVHPGIDDVADAVADLADRLDWDDIGLVYDPESGLFDEPTVLMEALQDRGCTVIVHPTNWDYTQIFVDFRKKGIQNFVVDVGDDELDEVLDAAQSTNMMDERREYIFTILDMQTIQWDKLEHVQADVYGFDIIDREKFQKYKENYLSKASYAPEETTEVAILLDSLEIVAQALIAAAKANIDLSLPRLSCAREKDWDSGGEFYERMDEVKLEGLSGPVAFDEDGTRSTLALDIFKVDFEDGAEKSENGLKKVGRWVTGPDLKEQGLVELEEEEEEAPEDDLIVTTLLEPPFLKRTGHRWSEEDDEDEDDSSSSSKERVSADDIDDDDQETKYEGYIKDLLRELSRETGFKFIISPTPDKKYGSYNKSSNSWDGMVGEVIEGDAHLAVAPLTITAKREQALDFSVPFMASDLTIIFKEASAILEKQSGESPLALFRIFSAWLWVLIVVAYVVVSVVLALVSRVSPYQPVLESPPPPTNATSSHHHYQEPPPPTSPCLGQGITICNAFWITAATLVLRGADIPLRAVSTRLVCVVWWIFALVTLVTYAALVQHSVAVEQGPEPLPRTISDLLDQPHIDFGVLKNGASHYLLKNSQHPLHMRLMERIRRSDSPYMLSYTKARERVLHDPEGDFAFIMEEMEARFLLAEHCNLHTAGTIDTRYYAIAMAKDSDYIEAINYGLLTLQENGVLQKLERKWWEPKRCKRGPLDDPNDWVHVSVSNFAVPLVGLLIFLVLAIVVALVERILYNRTPQPAVEHPPHKEVPRDRR